MLIMNFRVGIIWFASSNYLKIKINRTIEINFKLVPNSSSNAFHPTSISQTSMIFNPVGSAKSKGSKILHHVFFYYQNYMLLHHYCRIDVKMEKCIFYEKKQCENHF